MLLGAILVVLLIGVARATDVLALVQASSNPSSNFQRGATAAAGDVSPSTTTPARAAVAPLGELRTADVLMTADRTIPPEKIADISRLPGIESTESFRFGTVDLAGNRVPAFGVNPSTFRNWAVSATAASDGFWSSLAGGEASASFQTGKDLALPLGARMPIGARSSEVMRLGSFATVGLPDAEAVLSDSRAAEIGLPAGSGLLISAPTADLRSLTGALSAVSGTGVAVRPLKALPQAGATNPGRLDVPSGSTGATNPGPSSGSQPSSGSYSPSGSSSVAAPSSASAAAVIQAAKSKIGAPYVYGASGPNSFDCSGFTSWAFAQVGVGLPRTAQEQWLSGPHVSYADARPGDILAWAGDPSAPNYVTHVAIYLGNGQMISAPHSGTTVNVSSVYTSGLLGAVRVLS